MRKDIATFNDSFFYATNIIFACERNGFINALARKYLIHQFIKAECVAPGLLD